MKISFTYMAKSIMVIAFGLIVLSATSRTIKTTKTGKTSLVLTGKSDLKLQLTNTVGFIKFAFVETEKGTFARIKINHYAKSQVVGEPELPVRGRLIEIPQDATPQITIKGYDVKEYKLSDYGVPYKLIPCQGPQSKCGAATDFIWNKDSYRADSFTDTKLVTVDVLGQMRAVRIARLNINPVQYNPVKNTIRVYENLSFEITFVGANLAKTNDLKRRYYSPYFETTYKAALLNYSHPASRDTLTHYPVKYAIVADRMFESQLQPFIEWKTKKGFTVTVGYTDVIGNTKEDIKSWLQFLYAFGTDEDPAPSFALFVGDIAQVAVWNNGNGVTDRNSCEFTNDLFPEMYYGRFSAEDSLQLQPYIDKTLEYEQYTMPNPAFLDSVVMIAGVDSGHGHDWGNGQINYGTINYFNEAHDLYSHTYLYPESGSHSADIIQNISNGVSFANYTAHGSPNGWYDPSFTISDIPTLQNFHKYGLLIGNCCSTSEFQTDCFAEELLRAKHKGALGYIGGSNSTYWDEDYYFGVGVGTISENPPTYEQTGLGNYDRAFHDHGEPYADWHTTMDQQVFAGNLAVSESGSTAEEYYWDIYNLMGDPSLMIYYSQADEMTVTAPASILIGATSINVTAAPYSYVALSMDGNLKAAVLADSLGNAELTFDPFTVPGTADFVVTGQNYQPYISTIEVIPADGPFVTYQSHWVNDTANGNGNGNIDYGEDVYLSVWMENAGGDDADSVMVTLSANNDPYVTLEDSTENYGTIPANDSVLVQDAFQIAVSQSTPNNYVIHFSLTSIFDNDTTVSSFTEPVFAPELNMGSYTIDDSNGNGNGKLDPGETANFNIGLVNNGGIAATNIMGMLASDNEYITVNSNSVSYGDLEPDSSRTESFSVTAAPDSPDATIAQFNFNWIADNGISGADSFNIIVGQKQVVIINLATSTISPDSMVKCLDILSTPSDVVTDIPDDLSSYRCAFVCLGIYSNNHALTSEEGDKLADFLNNGGRIYMEGGDTWYFDSPTAVHPMFHIIGLEDGSDDLGVIAGSDSNFMTNFVYTYEGANNYIDVIAPDSSSQLLMYNTNPMFNTAVSYFNDTYKTIGATFEFGGLADNESCNKAGYMAEILSFFDVSYVWTGTEKGEKAETNLTLYPNPASTRLAMNFNSNKSAETTIVVYDMAGRMVMKQLKNIHPGHNIFNLNVSNLKNGIYSVELNIGGNVQTKKLVIAK